MNKNKIFSAIMRGFEVSGINALSSAAGSSSLPSTALCRRSSTPAADSDTTH